MSILTAVTLTAVRYVVGAACKGAGLDGLVGAADQAIGFLADYYTDHSRKVAVAIEQANDRAWRTVEVALAGDSLWGRLFTRTEDRSLAEQLRQAIAGAGVAAPAAERAEFRAACLKELREARRQSLLSKGGLDPRSLRQSAGQFAEVADPNRLLEAEWQAAGAMADELHRSGFPNLGQFLRLRVGPGLPLFVVAVRYYFRRAVEADAELSRGLMFAKLESAGTAQEERFATLGDMIDRHAARLESLLGDLAQSVSETRESVERIEAGMVTRDDLDRVKSEMIEAVRQALAQQGGSMPSTTQMVQSEQGQRVLLNAMRRFRELPLEVQRRNPELYDLAGQIGMLTGNFDQAQKDYAELPLLLRDEQSKAQAHNNAHRAALEKAAKSDRPEDWDAALAELLEAAKLDPRRFAPFDLSKYEPLKILGVGGFGVTFLCRHRASQGSRVIKTLHVEQLDEASRQRVLEEGRILEQLRHPNIVRLHDIEFAAPPDQRPYFVMEHCEGFVTLEQYVTRNGKVKPGDFVPLARQIALGLKAAHDKGILHRDIKPANILVRREGAAWEVRLIDFGLALRTDLLGASQSSSSRDGQNILLREIAGTRAYAPPEQMDESRQAEVGKHSDIFSLGKACYYALFQAPTPDDDDKQKLPSEWRFLLGRCTAETVNKRPRNADEVIKALEAGEQGRREPPSKEVVLKAAGASLLPGLGHILLGQPVKGGIFMAVGLLFLLGWWWYLALIVGGLLVLGGGPVLGIAAIAALSGGIQAAMNSKVRRVVLGLVCLALPFVLLPAVVECPWPTHFLAWVLVAAADAALTAWVFGGKRGEDTGEGGDPALRGAKLTYLIGDTKIGPVPVEEIPDLIGQSRIHDETYVFIKGVTGKEWVRFKTIKGRLPGQTKAADAMPGWTLFGERMARLDPKRSALGGVASLGCVVLSLFISGWLFGPSSTVRQQLVGTWDLRDGGSVEFTRDGAALHHSRHGSTDQGRYRLSGSRILEITSTSGFMSRHTDRYTLEFATPDELVLVAQERSAFDGMERGSFPSIAGKLSRGGANPAAGIEPDVAFLGRWMKADSRNDAGEEESIVVTGKTLLYSKPRVRVMGLEQHTTGLTWVTPSKAKLAKGNGSLQLEAISDREIVVSFQGSSFDFDKVAGRYRKAKE